MALVMYYKLGQFIFTCQRKMRWGVMTRIADDTGPPHWPFSPPSDLLTSISRILTSLVISQHSPKAMMFFKELCHSKTANQIQVEFTKQTRYQIRVHKKRRLNITYYTIYILVRPKFVNSNNTLPTQLLSSLHSGPF